MFRSISFSRAGPALSTAVLWCALAAGAAYWVLHFPGPRAAVLPGVQTTVPAQTANTDHVGRALGHVPSQAVVAADSSRFSLLGVISSASGHGSALIAIDGQPPKAWRVGQALQEGVYLQKLAPRQAWLGQTLNGPAQWALQMSSPGAAP